MIARRLFSAVEAALSCQPAVVLLGPRQVGKTTLALALAQARPSVYLDLELPAERQKLADPELYLRGHQDELVILDEIQRLPNVFETLRGLIDQGRRRGRRAGRFLLLGSASLDLIRQSSETLAGRVAHLELTPFDALEVGGSAQAIERLWLRGGFPESFLAADDAASLAWRSAFVRSYLERDIPQLGPRIPAETLRRFWTMLAHLQGSVLNAARVGGGLGLSGQTVARYTDLLVDLLLVRRLGPLHRNAGKRLVKSPKVYVRDSGIVHGLLGIPSTEALFGHPVVGPSWEGFVVETLLDAAPSHVAGSFYRTQAGAEIDLVLEFAGGDLWAIEIKRGLAPKLTRGFHFARGDLEPTRSFVVYSGEERYPMAENVEAIGLRDLVAELAGQ